MTIKKQIRVMKFGGTSVGDASCFLRAASLIASSEHPTVAVVSAMVGITNAILEASERAATGDLFAGTMLADMLQCRHSSVAYALVSNEADRRELQVEIKTLAGAAGSICDEIAELAHPDARLNDALWSIGERLAARLLAAALQDRGCPALAIDATSLIVTSDRHGEAEPDLVASRARVRTALRPLTAACVIPVITGFIGATPQGAATTLGRGGSDYSATILAACLDAESVIIWTDVDGVMTADPKIVPDARTITELSYHEATAFAQAGAKVIHPKTLRPIIGAGIPVQIRNTFATECVGTWVTRTPRTSPESVTAIGTKIVAEEGIVTLLGDGLPTAVKARIECALAGTGIAYKFGECNALAALTLASGDLPHCVQLLHSEFDLSRERAQNRELAASEREAYRAARDHERTALSVCSNA